MILYSYLLFGVACGGGRAQPDSDSDSDVGRDTALPVDSGTIPLSTGPLAVGQDMLECDQDGVPTSLSAELTPAGDVLVRHELALNECLEGLLFEVEATIFPSMGLIELSYFASHDSEECTTCDLDVSYVLKGVPPGTWNLDAGAVEAVIVVP
jgi:hypothetical protein